MFSLFFFSAFFFFACLLASPWFFLFFLHSLVCLLLVGVGIQHHISYHRRRHLNMHTMICILYLFQLFLFVVVTGQPEGWRMIDRFYGFRYSLNANEAVMDKVLKFADKLGCFGWIQNVQDNVVDGALLLFLLMLTVG